MRRHATPPQGKWRIFRWPLGIGCASAIGLVSALIGDGLFDLVSWITLGLTIIVMIAAWRGWSAA
jgi:hypothetical protein